ncbi:MAG: hypothetical protein K0S53_399 [Bacteroidetes bacterium]|jgi:hypothetical protein|nr:hypothetical protein [Bacteroidota bacterium]
MALQKEIWINDIQENLFKNNAFILRSVNHSAWVAYKTVHIPNAGSNPSVSKNRASLPATIAQRTDSDLTYNLSEYTTDPMLLTDIDALQVSYDKRASILMQHIDTLGEVIGNNTAYAWVNTLDSTRMVRTTGSASSAALAPSATGTRKAITLADIAALRAKLDNDNTPSTGRVLLIPADLYNTQLLAISELTNAQSFGTSALPDGVVNRIYGFDIVIRPTVVVYSGGTGATQTLKAVDATGTPSAPAATDNLAAIAYHPNFVATALGETKVFYDEDKPEYYGSMFSALVMHGAAALRSDLKGLAVLIQG